MLPSLRTQPLLVVFVLATAGGCQKTTGPEPQVVSESELTEQERGLRDAAHAVRDALAQRLKGRLMEELAASGPMGAVQVCSREAAVIADQVSEQLGVRVGRTSHRRRSPDNTPPAWAVSLVADRVDEPTYVRYDGRLNSLLPIRVGAECLLCHGDAATMPEPLVAAIDEAYPGDAARGFSLGDLRGWFWVECPTNAVNSANQQPEAPSPQTTPAADADVIKG